MRPKSNMTGVLIRVKFVHTDTQREDGHVKTEAKVGGPLTQAEECRGLLATAGC